MRAWVALFLILVSPFFSVAGHAAGKLKIYYSHPLSVYGTPQEKKDLETLVDLGFEVVNPDTPEFDAAYAVSKDFNVFLDAVSGCDALAFRAFPDGSISSGVAGEIKRAREKNIPVIELPSAIGKRTLTRDETTEFLEDSGGRPLVSDRQ